MNRQRWRRLGALFRPGSPPGDWGLTHAANPTALPLDDRVVRIFFSMRDVGNRAHLASADFEIDANGGRRISGVRGPLLSPGERGSFDADGVTLSSLVPDGDRLLAYYLGWTKGVSVPFTNFIGVAIGDRDGTRFERVFRAPIVGRSEANPFSVAYPWVAETTPGDAGRRWRMWFASCTSWGTGGRTHRFVIRSADSTDLLTWRCGDDIAVSLAGDADASETALSGLTVARDADGFSMWYARLAPGYRLGYAWSADGNRWQRRDSLFALDGPAGDWEAREQTYPCVFALGAHRYLLYNGDGYGRTGFGLARLED